MLTICYCELQKLDLVIYAKKSSCIRIGPRNDVTWSSICSSSTSGVLLPWVKEMKYLGVIITSSRSFKISSEHSRRANFIALLTLYLAVLAESPQRMLYCNWCLVNASQFCSMALRLVHRGKLTSMCLTSWSIGSLSSYFPQTVFERSRIVSCIFSFQLPTEMLKTD